MDFMMYKISILLRNSLLGVLLLSFTSFSCNGQKKTENIEYQHKKNIKMDTVKKFDFERFYLYREKYKREGFIQINETTKIQQFETKEGFAEYVMTIGSLFYEYNSYYTSGALYQTCLMYKDDRFIKGVLKTYNESGKLIKEEDYDAPFTFTFEDILEYLKDNEMDIHSDRVTVSRYTGNNQDSYWIVDYRVSNYIISKTLDGRTGEVLSTEKIQIKK